MIINMRSSGVVNLTNPVDATIADTQGVGIIIDDDGAQAPQVLVNEKFETRRPLEEMPSTQKAIRDVETKLGRDGQ